MDNERLRQWERWMAVQPVIAALGFLIGLGL